MRTISGVVKSMPNQWLPILYNIVSPNLRRMNSLLREWTKCFRNTALPIHSDCIIANIKIQETDLETGRETYHKKIQPYV
jgi:hypothetical protein